MADATHPSMSRLLDFAREATRGEAARVFDWNDLRRRMNVSHQVMTNWKARGISAEGAVDAERLFGCSVLWITTGEGDRIAQVSREALERAKAWQQLTEKGREAFDRALELAGMVGQTIPSGRENDNRASTGAKVADLTAKITPRSRQVPSPWSSRTRGVDQGESRPKKKPRGE